MTEVKGLWQEVLTTALLGTDRRPPETLSADGELGRLLNKLDTSNPGRYLLQTASVLTLYSRVGIKPVRLQAEVNSNIAPDERLERCSPAAASRLGCMLEGTYPDLIPEWLLLAAKAGKRAAEETLPDLLAWGEAHNDQIDLVLPVLGERGRWLAARMPGIEQITAAAVVEGLSPAELYSYWEDGSKLERRQLLSSLRKRDPQNGLKILKSTWAEEGANERAEFVAVLKEGLSLADEPFLEACLDDRSVQVRREAVGLLTQLPESGLVQRQKERNRNYLDFIPGSLLKKARIEVNLPEICDDKMARDGLADKALNEKTRGEKLEWFLLALAAVPPSYWSRQWKKSPTELLEISKNGDWKDQLHSAWIKAAEKFGDADWIEAILDEYPQNGQLLRNLPEERIKNYLLKKLRSQPAEGIQILFVYQGQWGREITHLALPHIRGYMLDHNNQARLTQPKNTFLRQGMNMEASLFSEISKRLLKEAQPGTVWRRAVEELLAILEFRRGMMEELK